MAPAADMFELGVKVQVLKRGTHVRARAPRKLYDALPRATPSLEAIPADGARAAREGRAAARPLDEVWAETRRVLVASATRARSTRAERDPQHRMALVFRWYLGQVEPVGDRRRRRRGAPTTRSGAARRWARSTRWAAGSFLGRARERGPSSRSRCNLLEGAAVVTRAQQLRTYGRRRAAAGVRASRPRRACR